MTLVINSTKELDPTVTSLQGPKYMSLMLKHPEDLRATERKSIVSFVSNGWFYGSAKTNYR